MIPSLAKRRFLTNDIVSGGMRIVQYYKKIVKKDKKKHIRTLILYINFTDIQTKLNKIFV